MAIEKTLQEQGTAAPVVVDRDDAPQIFGTNSAGARRIRRGLEIHVVFRCDRHSDIDTFISSLGKYGNGPPPPR